MDTIKLHDANGKEYSLSYDLATVKRLSKNGFTIDLEASEIEIAVSIPDLFKYAFLRFHPEINEAKVKELWDNISDKQGLVRQLLSIYADPVNAIFEEPKDDSKKVTWEVIAG